MEELRVLAPAKVNLFLGIGGKRADGFHDAVSILHALALHDTLALSAYPSRGFAKELMGEAFVDAPTVEEEGLAVGVEMRWREGVKPAEVAPEDNLAVRAAFALARSFGFPGKGYLRMVVEKHIPLQAGLGGGSSDAAAALVGCCALWGIDARDERVHEVARSLGADVCFFLRGGCGVYGGRGDIYERALTPRKDSVLLVIPEGGVSTAAAYRAFDESPQPVPEALQMAAAATGAAADIPLFNNLAPAATGLLPELAAVREWAEGADGVAGVLLSGSGSATFCVCVSHEAALHLAVEAGAKGWRTRVTSFSALRAAALPSQSTTNLGATRV